MLAQLLYSFYYSSLSYLNTKLNGTNYRWAFGLILVSLIPVLNASEDSTDTSAIENESNLRVMTLNLYGWKTMPQHAATYATLISGLKIDILGVQEGVQDWKLTTNTPTDYSNADALLEALGDCWQQRYQIYVNKCRGNGFVENGRFDLTDGPNATRTGEYAIVSTGRGELHVINVHWDHESEEAQSKNAEETAAQLNSRLTIPTVLVGDFNSDCSGDLVSGLIAATDTQLLGSAGIDCIITRGLSGSGQSIEAAPSDHPAILLNAKLQPE